MALGSLWINDIYYVKDELEDHFNYGWEQVAGVTIGYPDKSELKKSAPNRFSVDTVTKFR
jgi:hypothetical protein